MKANVNDWALRIYSSWFDQLKVHKVSGGPARGSIAAALLILDKLQTDFNLDLDSYKTKKGQSQIAGLSASAIAGVLRKYGEKRPFLKEGGRTNRGVAGDMGRMLKAIAEMKLDELTESKRNLVLQQLQLFLIQKINAFHNRQVLKVPYNPYLSTWEFIHGILKKAGESGKEGQVAQYLVGAKLQLRYPDISIENYSYSTADEQLKRKGDFQINDTIFHITVSPMQAVYDKCRSNVDEGFRVYLLVPDRALQYARSNPDMYSLSGKVFIGSIESFVGQNVEELSIFSRSKIVSGLRELLEIYNQRVAAAETDKSLLITIPPNMTQ
ncbi:MAG: DUF4928 family protein [Chloroflexi bacterium]|nr:DUF4928 family protein [Chloroflexota bacterium]